MAYKAILGLSEIVVGVLLAIPSFDPQATFARLSAEELREDPGDRFVAQVSRHLPALLHHRGHGEHGRARRARAPCAGLAAWSAIPRPTQPPIGAASLDVQLIRTPPPLIASTLGAYPPAPTAAFDSCARHNG
jgi:hypothetical protein